MIVSGDFFSTYAPAARLDAALTTGRANHERLDGKTRDSGSVRPLLPHD
jgi:hypothetical protein